MEEKRKLNSNLQNRSNVIGTIINTVFIAFEFFCGFLANSMALIADAVHNLGDVLSLVISMLAVFLLTKKPTKRHTYGFYNTTILSASVNSLILAAGLAIVIWESLMRLFTNDQTETVSWIVAGTAFLGILINGLTAYLMRSNADLNERANFWHFFGDTLVSVSVLVAAIIIYFTGWYWIDPIISILASIFILFESWSVFCESFELVTNAVPRDIEEREVESYLLSLPKVDKINDMHIWPLSTTDTALSAHLEVTDFDDCMNIVDRATNGLRKKFHIDHITIQLDTSKKKHNESQI